jgi:hypothetical protein
MLNQPRFLIAIAKEYKNIACFFFVIAYVFFFVSQIPICPSIELSFAHDN